jgi:hypothetical protein
MSQATPFAPMTPLTAGGQVASPRSQFGSPNYIRDQASAGFGKDVEEIKQQVRAGSEGLREGLSSAVAQAKDRAYSLAEQQKQAGAEGLETIARAVRGAANGFRDQTPEIARQVDAAASGIERISENLKETSVDDVVTALQHFARAQPLAFFLGAGVTGLLIARLIQSSAEDQPSSQEHAYGSGERPLPRPSPDGNWPAGDLHKTPRPPAHSVDASGAI